MDERMHGSDDAQVHRVDEREVRLAMDRLDLADRTLNVYRATAFLTALGITVSHDGIPEPGASPAPHDGVAPTPPGSSAAADEDEPDAATGDVANLIEVQGWLRNRGPAMTVDQFRERRRMPVQHRRATA